MGIKRRWSIAIMVPPATLPPGRQASRERTGPHQGHRLLASRHHHALAGRLRAWATGARRKAWERDVDTLTGSSSTNPRTDS